MPTLIQQYRTLKISLEKSGGISNKTKKHEHTIHQEAFRKTYKELRIETNYLKKVRRLVSEWHEIFQVSL